MSIEMSALFLFLTMWFLLIGAYQIKIYNAVSRTNKILDKIFKACSYRSEDTEDAA